MADEPSPTGDQSKGRSWRSRFIIWLLSPKGGAFWGMFLSGAAFFYGLLQPQLVSLTGKALPPMATEWQVLAFAVGIMLPFASVFWGVLERLEAFVGDNNSFDSILKAQDTIGNLRQENGLLGEKVAALLEQNEIMFKCLRKPSDPAAFDPKFRLEVPISISNFNNFLAYAPLYVAIRQQLFLQEQLSVSISSSEDDQHAVRKLMEGSANFAITDPAYCFRENGIERSYKAGKVQVIAPFLNRAALWAVSKTDLNSGSGGAARPIKATTYPKGSTAYVLAEEWKKSYPGMQFEIFPLEKKAGEPFSDYLKRLLSCSAGTSEADALLVSEPEATWLSRSGMKGREGLGCGTYPFKIDLHRLLFHEEDFIFTAVLTTEDFIKNHPGIVYRFLKALRIAFLVIHSLPSLPTCANGRETDADHLKQVAGFVSKTASWKSVIESIKYFFSQAYPGEMDELIQRNDALLAVILESLRKAGYFPVSVTFPSNFHNLVSTSLRKHALAEGQRAEAASLAAKELVSDFAQVNNLELWETRQRR